jgi:hypothetical protein
MVEQQIQDKLNREPTLANTEIGIAQSYAGHRRIVDKIKIQRQA